MSTILSTTQVTQAMADRISADPGQKTNSEVNTALLKESMEHQKGLVNDLLSSLGKGQNLNLSA